MLFWKKTDTGELINDQKKIVELCHHLILAMVDVLSTKSLLQSAIKAMELSQMVIQGMWLDKSPLYQLPFFDENIVRKLKSKNIQDIVEFINMDDNERKDILQMSDEQLDIIADVCNRYPSIDMQIKLNDNTFEPNGQIEINVSLSRDIDAVTLTPVPSSYYLSEKEEAWWLVIGDYDSNSLLAIKRFTFVKDFKITLKITAPATAGKYSYSVFLICDSWIGCDQEEKIELSVE